MRTFYKHRIKLYSRNTYVTVIYRVKKTFFIYTYIDFKKTHCSG